jgi:C-terminal peptidase prc
MRAAPPTVRATDHDTAGGGRSLRSIPSSARYALDRTGRGLGRWRTVKSKQRSGLLCVLIGLGLGCAGQQRTDGQVTDAIAEIERVAQLVHKDMVSAPSLDALRDAAVRELIAVAEGRPSGSIRTRNVDIGELLEATVRQLRESRPELGEAGIAVIGLKAMAASLNNGSQLIPLPPAVPGRVGAVGLHLSQSKDDPFPRIERALPSSPAAAAQLLTGAELRAIDGQPLAGVPLAESTRRLAGPVGSPVRLSMRGPAAEEVTVTLQRAAIDRGALDCRILAERVLYLGVNEISKRTAATAKGFEGVIPGGPAPVILDLRNSDGGTVAGSGALADLFFDSGYLFTAKAARGAMLFSAVAGSSVFERSKVIVLVGSGTDSGAELVAAAIQDHHRGTVMGNRTAGHLRMEERFPAAGGIFYLVVTHLLRPNGEEIDGHGVQPDVVAAIEEANPVAKRPDRSCPGVLSPAPVVEDPLVAQALRVLIDERADDHPPP